MINEDDMTLSKKEIAGLRKIVATVEKIIGRAAPSRIVAIASREWPKAKAARKPNGFAVREKNCWRFAKC